MTADDRPCRLQRGVEAGKSGGRVGDRYLHLLLQSPQTSARDEHRPHIAKP